MMALVPDPRPLRQLYVNTVLDLYRKTPGTTGRVRPPDRRLAAELYDRGVPLDLVRFALVLATLRRSLRPSGASPLPTIRSLHYFLPVIDEQLADPPEPGWADYLMRKLGKVAPDFAAAIAPRFP